MTNSILTKLLREHPVIPPDAEVMMAVIDIPPGGRGTPPHRSSGPVFGYVLEGELLYELEGEPARVVCSGDVFWEPGGDVIHYQSANNLDDAWTRAVVVLIGHRGAPMLSVVAETELEQRCCRRAL